MPKKLYEAAAERVSDLMFVIGPTHMMALSAEGLK